VNAKRLTLLLAAVMLSLWLAAGSAAGATQPGRLQGGDPLERLRSGDRSGAGVQAGSSRRAGLIWLALVSVPALIIALSALEAKRPEGGPQMRRRFTERKADDEPQDESSPSLASRLEGYTTEPIVERPRSEASGDGEDRHVPTFSELGEHVASVLETARQAAERIEAEGRRKAEELEAEAAQARSEAAEAADEIRARADAYAEEKRREADEAAAEIVARAERAATDRARAADERHQALSASVERTEERLRRLVTGLRELAGRLDVLVASDGAAEREPDRSAPALDEALRRQVAAEEPVEETGVAEVSTRET
jgi:hypothetical protein